MAPQKQGIIKLFTSPFHGRSQQQAEGEGKYILIPRMAFDMKVPSNI
jgi:hypothetical protein